MTIEGNDDADQARGYVMAIQILISVLADGMGAIPEKMALRGIEKLADTVAGEMAVLSEAAREARGQP
jgi:hypothetical protein